MKVLYITNYDTMYGANTSLLGMMIALKNKYNVEPYLLVSGSGKIKELCDKAGIQCFCYDFRISAVDERIRWKQLRKWTRRWMRYVDFYRVERVVRKKRICFDMVHSNSSIFDIGLFLAGKWGVPHVWHVREFAREDYGLEFVFGRYAFERKLLRSDSVIAISDEIRNRVFSINKKINVERIYNGVDIVRQYEKKYFIGGEIRFCIVGSIQPRKNQLDVVKACKRLTEKGISNYRLYIVGDDTGTYCERIWEYLDNNPEIKDKVVFTGYRDDVNQLLKDMDIGVMASDAEAFGRVTVEYMANYMPVIATKTGGTPEIVGEAGAYYIPHDIDRLSELMALYMKDNELVQLSGKMARERALGFTTKRNSERVYEVYKEVSHAAG